MSKEKKKTVWFGMKLTPKQKDKIRILARRRGVSQKQAVLDLVEKEIKDKPLKAKPGSLLAVNRDLYGAGKGPGDVSTNPTYLEEFGK